MGEPSDPRNDWVRTVLWQYGRFDEDAVPWRRLERVEDKPLPVERIYDVIFQLVWGRWVANSIDRQKIECSEASCHSSGCKSHQQRSPVAVVVVTSNGKGDRPVGSLVVKVPDGREAGRIRTGGQQLGSRSKCVNRVSHEIDALRETD